jgi:flagellar hook-basal body complex protein FliE
MPIDPAFAVNGAEWQIGPATGGATPQAPSGSGFQGALAQQVGRLADLQQEAAAASRDLAAGTATDPATTVMAIERARLAMQLASQIRTKGVEALQDVFHTSV